jgi:hypothetical protein
LRLSSEVMQVTPVMFSPGRARLVTNPCSTASSDDAITMGMVLVAVLAACVCGPAPARMRPPPVDDDVLSFNPPQLAYRLPEGRLPLPIGLRGRGEV